MKKNSADVTAIILAAGEGTRMKSKIPKVLHPLADRPLIAWVLDAARKAGAKRMVAVLGHQAERVAGILPTDVLTAIQDRQLGTGHAVKAAQKALAGVRGEVLVLCGDAPLIRPETLRRLLQSHRRLKAKGTVLTARLANPFGYGRILRDAPQSPWVTRIVEERDAGPEERAVTEVNSGAYCFDIALLWEMLGLLQNNNRKGEYYLTDVVELMRQRRHPVAAVSADADASEILGINSRLDLAKAARALNDRVLAEWMNRGVTILDPTSTWVEPGVKIGQDCLVHPGVRLTGKTVIGEACQIGPQTWVDDSRIGRDCKIRYSILESVRVADRVRIGPFSHLRPGAVVESEVYIGNFAEINRSRVQQGVKVGHVSYLGDAVVGKRTNIGAGSITANYDGVKKNATRIGEDAFIGSGTVMVAPCQIGRGSLTGAGAVLKRGTRIPPQTVAVGVPARVIKKREKQV